MCSLRVYNFSCLCSLRYAFQPHSKLCVLSGMLFNLIVSYVFSQGIQSQGFLIVFYVLSRSVSGSPGGTTPSILIPDLVPPTHTPIFPQCLGKSFPSYRCHPRILFMKSDKSFQEIPFGYLKCSKKVGNANI